MSSSKRFEDGDNAPGRVSTRCPHCREVVVVEFRAYLDNMGKLETNDPVSYRQTLDDHSRLMLEEGERDGTLAAYTDAVMRIHERNPPKNVERNYLAFLRTCTPAKMHAAELDALRAEFPGRMETFQQWGVCGVVVDGRLRTFVPYYGEKSQKKVSEVQRAQVLRGWIRSSYGYISGPGPFFDAMRSNRTRADFGRMVQ